MTPSSAVNQRAARRCAAFVSDRRVASGDLASVLTRVKELFERGRADGVLLFDEETGRQFEVRLDGTLEEVLAREVPEPPPQGRGRPKLGVTAREVTLLPRHWGWLERQPNGVSAALRRLVEEARKREPDEEEKREARDAAYRFMTALAGDRAGYEEALRALYARDRTLFARHIKGWPRDVRECVETIAERSF